MYRESLEASITIEPIDHGMHWTLAVHVSKDERIEISNRHREFSLRTAAPMDVCGHFPAIVHDVYSEISDVGYIPSTSHPVPQTAKCPLVLGSLGLKRRLRCCQS